MLIKCGREAVPVSVKTSIWLLRLMIPISLAVRMLQFYGVIDWMAQFIDPLFVHIGLPGYSAIAFLTGAFVTTYAGIAVMMSMVLTLREATIISIMMCICHALLVESAVVKKTGSSFIRMAVIRLVAAFVCGAYLNAVLPEMGERLTGGEAAAVDQTLQSLIGAWAWASLKMSAMIFALIYALMLVQRMLDDSGMLYRFTSVLQPLMRVFGLPKHAAYMWVVGNVLGISYGSAVMLDMEDNGVISREEANDVNYHLIMNHSMLEDTCVFAMMGISAWWILSTRMLFALVLVWGRKLLLKL